MPALLPVLANRVAQRVQRYPEVFIHPDPSDGIRSEAQKLNCFLNASVHLRGGIEPKLDVRTTNAPLAHIDSELGQRSVRGSGQRRKRSCRAATHQQTSAAVDWES